MLVNLPSYLRPTVAYDDPLTEQRARSLMIYLIVGFVLSIAATLLIASQLTLQAVDGNLNISLTEIPALVSPLFVLIFYWAVRNGYYHVGAYGILILSMASLASFWDSSLSGVGVIAFVIPVVISGLLLGWRATLGAFLFVLAIATGPTLINNSLPVDFLTLALILFIVTSLVIAFGTSVQSTAVRFINELNKLQGIMQDTVNSTQEVDEHRMAVNTINTVRDKLGYTFARIYMVEDGEVIQRIQTGLNLTQINVDSDIQLSSRSGIYEAVRTKELVVMQEGDDPIIRQHLLSGTRAAIAVPVLDSRDNVIAVLDIQSEDLTVYTAIEINTLHMVSSQLGRSIERLRQLTNLRRDLIEQDELITRQRNRLLQYERAERQTTTDTWRDYLQQQGVDFLGYDMRNWASEPVEAHTMTDEIESAIQTGDISVTIEGNQQVVSVPINLRGQTLGAMSFKVPQGSQVVGARQQELIRNVVQRLSLALENKRLFEQSQSQAKRESKANEVGNLLLSSTDINTVLQLAAENFNEALGAVQTQIRLKPEVQKLGEGEGKP